MRKNFLLLGFLMLGVSPIFMSCSSDENLGFPEENNVNFTHDITLKEEVSKPTPTRMSVADFINLVKKDCSKEELDFLSALSPSDTMYVYKKSEQNYPRINSSNLEKYKSLLKTGLSLKKVKSSSIVLNSISSRSDIIERRNFSHVIKSNYNAIIEGRVTLDGYFSYMYDVIEDKAVPGYGATISGSVITDAGDPSLVLRYEPQSNICDVMPDRISLSYSMIGQIVLGAAFGDFAAGAPIEQVSEYGTLLIPLGGGSSRSN